ncbi:ATP-binding protein [Actinopolymorpha pittospori]
MTLAADRPDADLDDRPLAEVHRDLTVAELAVVRAHLTGTDPAPAEAALADLRARAAAPSPLDELTDGLRLSPFERATLLLACGPDLVGAVARELAESAGGPRLTFASALEVLPGAHWDALTHGAPLRRWQLLRLADPDAVLTSPLVPDERVVHHLVGVGTLDEQLELASHPLDVPPHLTPSHASVVADVVSRWQGGSTVVLRGPQPRSTRALAAAACAAAGLWPRLLGANALAMDAAGVATTLRRLVRETVLGRVAWVLDVDEASAPTVAELGRLLVGSQAPILLVSSTRPGGAALDALGLPVVEVPRLGAGERLVALTVALARAGAGAASDDELGAAAGLFDLALPDIDAAAADVADGTDLWTACRRRPRADVGALARVRTARVGWEGLVLPARELEQLRALASTVRHRARVLDDWGFGDRTDRGRGTTALFAGESGTGKTYAAEVIAHDLGLDLVHVDLSQVVDKYLGETEKRLARLFDAAEDGGMVLLFDEADALFGKRSEVKDSHDRYANVEVGYLLQRLEAFGGLAILTTNARSALDPAFTRRLAVIVDFPYPDRASRERMWDLSLPAALPRADVSLARLADADLSGGAIAAAALQAAYLAAADGGVVTMEHLGRAVRWELAKTGRVAGGSGGRRLS